MLAGIGLGYVLRQKKQLVKQFNRSTFGIILLLLFVLGISVGSNQDLMGNISTLGLRGLQLALVSLLGSVLMAWLVYVLFFKEKENER